MQLVKNLEGDSPIILTQPHGGTYIPRNILNQYNEIGLCMSDTDWNINRLYDGLLEKASVVQALFSRYVIDVNRDPSGESLYPGQNTTELCPTKNFEGQPIYKNGMEPDSKEVEKDYRVFTQFITRQSQNNFNVFVKNSDSHCFLIVILSNLNFPICLRGNCQI